MNKKFVKSLTDVDLDRPMFHFSRCVARFVPERKKSTFEDISNASHPKFDCEVVRWWNEMEVPKDKLIYPITLEVPELGYIDLSKVSKVPYTIPENNFNVELVVNNAFMSFIPEHGFYISKDDDEYPLRFNFIIPGSMVVGNSHRGTIEFPIYLHLFGVVDGEIFISAKDYFCIGATDVGDVRSVDVTDDDDDCVCGCGDSFDPFSD